MFKLNVNMSVFKLAPYVYIEFKHVRPFLHTHTNDATRAKTERCLESKPLY